MEDNNSGTHAAADEQQQQQQQQQQQEQQKQASGEEAFVDNSTSAQRLAELNAVEQMIAEVLHFASRAVALVRDATHTIAGTDSTVEGDEEDRAAREYTDKVSEEFKWIAESYLERLNNIQQVMRIQFNSIASMHEVQLPMTTSTYGEQKDLELWTNALSTIKQQVDLASQSVKPSSEL